MFFSVQNVYAAQDGVCLNYQGVDCTQFRYCTSKTNSGCNGYETCTLENGKFACVTNLEQNTKIYRPQNFVDQKVRNLRKPKYTSPIVEESFNKHMNDYFFPSRDDSRYPRINQDNYKACYPPKDQPYTMEETYPRRDVWVDSNPPYYKALFKKKYPDHSSHVGTWPWR